MHKLTAYELKRRLLAPRSRLMRRRHTDDDQFTQAMFELHYYRPTIYRFVEFNSKHPDLLWDADLAPGDLVLDVGAYRGEWTTRLLELHPGVRVHAFEPVPNLHRALTRKTSSFDDVTAHQFGVAARDETVTMALAGPGSSAFGHGAKFGDVEVPLRDAAAVFEEIADAEIDLCKVNIEGGEYDMFDRLIETGWLPQVRQFSIQFHEWIPGAHRRRRAIRKALGEHHDEVWNHPWVWEFWRRRPGGV